MSEHVVIVLPLPNRILSPNCVTGSRKGRMAKAASAKKHRRLAREAAEAQEIETAPWGKATVVATFFHKTRRKRDDVNSLAMLKPYYDGIVDSGLLEDDDHEHLTTLPARYGHDKEEPRVELLIERVA